MYCFEVGRRNALVNATEKRLFNSNCEKLKMRIKGVEKEHMCVLTTARTSYMIAMHGSGGQLDWATHVERLDDKQKSGTGKKWR